MATGCRQEHSEGGGLGVDTPEPTFGIEKEDLLEIIHTSERPFVLVNFFATWCRPCREEMPDLVQLQHDEKAQIKVVLISVDKPNDAKAKLHNFLNDYNVDFPTYARTKDEAAFIKDFYLYWDGRIPLSLLYNNKGEQLDVFKGMTDSQEIKMVVNRHAKLGGNS